MREKSEALKCTHTHDQDTHTRTVRAWHSVRRINGNKAMMYVCHASPLLLLLLMAYGKYLKIKNQNADTLGQLTL